MWRTPGRKRDKYRYTLAIPRLKSILHIGILGQGSSSTTEPKPTVSLSDASFNKVSGNKRISINNKTGKITIKKGLKKGTYKIKIKETAKESANYEKGIKTVTAKIKIK